MSQSRTSGKWRFARDVGAVGCVVLTIVDLIDGGSGDRSVWYLAALFGAISWGTAGAITGKDRNAMATAIGSAGIGVIVSWFLESNDSERMFSAVILGGTPGVILGSIAASPSPAPGRMTKASLNAENATSRRKPVSFMQRLRHPLRSRVRACVF
jgi:hypothetical protein